MTEAHTHTIRVESEEGDRGEVKSGLLSPPRLDLICKPEILVTVSPLCGCHVD